MSEIIINKKNYFHNLNIISNKADMKNKVALTKKDNIIDNEILKIVSFTQKFVIKKAYVNKLKYALKNEDFFEKFSILEDNNINTYSHTFHVVINKLEKIFQLPKNTNVHLKIDTKMDKNGIPKIELKKAFYGLLRQNLNLTGIIIEHKNLNKLSCEFHTQKREFGLLKEEVKNICEQLFLPLPKFYFSNLTPLFKTSTFDDNFAKKYIVNCEYMEDDLAFDNIELKTNLLLERNKKLPKTSKNNQSVQYEKKYLTNKNVTISTYTNNNDNGFFIINKNEITSNLTTKLVRGII